MDGDSAKSYVIITLIYHLLNMGAVLHDPNFINH